jgi:hypothetical protein
MSGRKSGAVLPWLIVVNSCVQLSATVIASRTGLAYYYRPESSNYTKNRINKNKANRLILLNKSSERPGEKSCFAEHYR